MFPRLRTGWPQQFGICQWLNVTNFIGPWYFFLNVRLWVCDSFVFFSHLGGKSPKHNLDVLFLARLPQLNLRIFKVPSWNYPEIILSRHVSSKSPLRNLKASLICDSPPKKHPILIDWWWSYMVILSSYHHPRPRMFAQIEAQRMNIYISHHWFLIYPQKSSNKSTFFSFRSSPAFHPGGHGLPHLPGRPDGGGAQVPQRLRADGGRQSLGGPGAGRVPRRGGHWVGWWLSAWSKAKVGKTWEQTWGKHRKAWGKKGNTWEKHGKKREKHGKTKSKVTLSDYMIVNDPMN